MLKARIYTKSNYRNLNGTEQEVVEIVGDRVTCRVWLEELGIQNVDFTKEEVSLVKTSNNN